jgi:methanogenic corrinoid protein MtbC1
VNFTLSALLVAVSAAATRVHMKAKKVIPARAAGIVEDFIFMNGGPTVKVLSYARVYRRVRGQNNLFR